MWLVYRFMRSLTYTFFEAFSSDSVPKLGCEIDKVMHTGGGPPGAADNVLNFRQSGEEEEEEEGRRRRPSCANGATEGNFCLSPFFLLPPSLLSFSGSSYLTIDLNHAWSASWGGRRRRRRAPPHSSDTGWQSGTLGLKLNV